MHEKEGGCSRRDAASGIFEATASKYEKMARTVREEGPSIIVEFDRPVPFYGWYLRVRKNCTARPLNENVTPSSITDDFRKHINEGRQICVVLLDP